MTPMIDVTFQLIIFFLLSSHLAQQETQMELDLPAAASGRQAVDDERPRLSVNVESDGSVMLGSTQTTPRRNDRPAADRTATGWATIWKFASGPTARCRTASVEPILLACADAGIWNVTFAVFKKVESRESRVESQSR